MGIDGVFVVLVELEQRARMADCGDDLFEHAQFVQSAEDFTESSWSAHESKEPGDGFFSDRLIGPFEHSFADGAPGFVFDASLVSVGDLHQFQDHAGILLDTFESFSVGPDFFESKPQVLASREA